MSCDIVTNYLIYESATLVDGKRPEVKLETNKDSSAPNVGHKGDRVGPYRGRCKGPVRRTQIRPHSAPRLVSTDGTDDDARISRVRACATGRAPTTKRGPLMLQGLAPLHRRSHATT